MRWTRRRVLQVGAGAVGAAALVTLGPTAQPAAADSRRIALRNVQTSEAVDLVYFGGGDYVPMALVAVRRVLRDCRGSGQHAIDPKLLDYLCALAKHLGAEPDFSVICGYRAPGSVMAQHSLHTQGRAIDVRMAGVDCADLAAGASKLSRGGVGYYKQSDFVHLDTGAFRTWKG